MLIESIEKWNLFAESLSNMGYRLWGMQYDVDNPEGFHAWFGAPGKPRVEVVTFDKAVRDAVVGFNAGLDR